MERPVALALPVGERALPEAAPVAAHVPVRQVLDDELDDPLPRARRLVGVDVGGDLGHEAVEAGEQPTVEDVGRLPT